MKHVWAEGYHAKVKAEVAAEELRRIAKEHGSVEASTVLAAARKKSSPLHDCFTWDDTEAAHNWRMTEARHVIIMLREVEDDQEEEPRRVWINVRPSGEQGSYMGRTVVLSTPNLKAIALESARKDCAAAESRLKEFIEFERERKKLASARASIEKRQAVVGQR